MLTGSELKREQVRDAIIASLADGAEQLLAGASIEGAAGAFDSDYFDESRYLTADIHAETVEDVQSVDELEVSRSEANASATVHATLALTLEAAQWNQMTDRLDMESDQAFDVPAELQVSAHLDDGHWQLGIDHIVVNR